MARAVDVLGGKKLKIILILIFLGGSFLRLYKINRFPVGFTPDEAAQGYTAYSILKTGKDEWGVRFPLNPRSFGDFKPPLQTYLMIPSLAVFGLNEFAVRLPNALLSSLALLGIYLLASVFFESSKIGLLSLFLLAFSPWHISLSRGAFEANLTVFFISFGIYFFLKGWQIPAAIFLGLNMFSYHSAKLITPLVVLLFLLYQKSFPKNKKLKNKNLRNKKFIILFSFFFLLALMSLFSGGQKRGADIAVFNPTDNWQAVADERWWAVCQKVPDFVARFFHNKVVYSVSQFAKNYFSYLSPQFLFSDGAGEGTYGMIPGRGVLWWWELPVILFGIYCFIKKPERKILLLLILVLLTPLPAALAKGVRSAGRTAVMMPWIQLFSAYALNRIMKFQISCPLSLCLGIADAANFKKIIFLFIFGIFFLFFLEDYFVQSPRKISKEMLYGRCEAIRWSAKQEADQIIVSRKLSEPQAYVMFCLQYPPELAQRETGNWLEYEKKGLSFIDQLGEYRLGKFVFREINWSSDPENEKLVLIGLPEEFPLKDKVKKIINYPNGDAAILLAL